MSVPRQFNNGDLLVDPAGQTRKYQSADEGGDIDYIRTIRQLVPRWGQMKLLLHEIWFLTHFADPIKHANSIVIYVGAAEGTHIPFLVQMFPWISQWHLYDPRSFTFDQPGQQGQIGEWSNRVILHTGDNGKFTDQIAQEWLQQTIQEDRYIFFITDIRDLGMTDDVVPGVHLSQVEQTLESNRLVDIDMRTQQQWYEILQPRIAKASLKFRLPYPISQKEWEDSGRAEENPYEPESFYEYLYGYMFKQPFTRPGSTETRLIPHNDDTGGIKRYSWNLKLYDQLMYYFTSQQRPLELYTYPEVSGETMQKLMELVPEFRTYNLMIQSPGISWDMASTIFIVAGYLDYADFDLETGLVPFIWAMLSNLNVVGYNRPPETFVRIKGGELYKEWNRTAVTLTSMTGVSPSWHPRAGTTWQLFLGQNPPTQSTMGVYRISPTDMERVQRPFQSKERR